MNNPNPSASLMLSRSLKVRQMVFQALKEYPQGRGDDMLLYLYILRKHYWRQVQIRLKDGVSIKTQTFEDFLMLPSWETCRRRRQEFQHNYAELRPTIRVRQKRMRLEQAYRDDFGFTGRETTLNDF